MITFLIIILLLAFLFFALLYWICWYTFGADPKRTSDCRDVPHGKGYGPYREKLLANVDALDKMPCRRVSIQSHDGLKLYARFYEQQKGAPVALICHGYRSTALRDGSGGMEFVRERGYNALLIDQRALGQSEGSHITFGIRERYDCLRWANWLVEELGPEVEIYLVGVSMGAATVMMASELDLPEQVKAIAADCGYSSPREILISVLESMKLPAKLCYPLVKLSARLFAKLDIEEASAVEAVKNAKVPVLFIHGDGDKFVPCWMSKACYEACASEKSLVLVPGAAHGISYYVDKEGYWSALDALIEKTAGKEEKV